METFRTGAGTGVLVAIFMSPTVPQILYRKLIQFGLMHGLIRHLQKYPVLPETGTLPLSHTYLSP